MNAPRIHFAARRRGAALIETALSIPIFALILVGTMFLGWAMMDQQQVKTATRYVPWRHANSGWEFDGIDPNTDANDAAWYDDPYHPGLNEWFFHDKAVSVNVSRHVGDNDEVEELADRAGDESNYAGQFADRLLVNPYPDRGVFPRAQGATVRAEFASDVDAFKKYTGSIRSYHIRDGVEWRRSEAGCRYVTRKMFLDGLDQVLDSIPDPGTDMGEMMRRTYINGW